MKLHTPKSNSILIRESGSVAWHFKKSGSSFMTVCGKLLGSLRPVQEITLGEIKEKSKICTSCWPINKIAVNVYVPVQEDFLDIVQITMLDE